MTARDRRGPSGHRRGRADAEAERRAYDELQAYTLAHRDPAFIHQYVVDAWGAQRADETTKSIRLAFALVGLYLHVERGFSGRRVQHAHRALAARDEAWPAFALPRDRGALTACDVIAAPPGDERDRAIDAWCSSVWEAFVEHRPAVAGLLARHGIA